MQSQWRLNQRYRKRLLKEYACIQRSEHLDPGPKGDKKKYSIKKKSVN